jgi:IclR family acetate operon transcriptional repressor
MTNRTGGTADPEGAFLSSVSRALEILATLAEGESQTLSELARSLDVNKNIAFRLVFTLEKLGYVYEDPATKMLRLTHKLSNIVRTQWLASDHLSQAQVVLKELAAQTGQLVRLATVSNGKLEWIFAETGSKRSLRIDPAYTGNIIPHVHATSKAYLMTLDESQLRAHVENMTFEAYSPHTITNAEDFLRNLQQARGRGFAMAYEERELGVAAVAAPILVRRSKDTVACAAVVSLSVPSAVLSAAELGNMARSTVLPTVARIAGFWPLD